MKKVPVEMLETMPGVDDGEIHPRDFEKGEKYDLGPDLARVFIDEGFAKGLEGGKDDDDAGNPSKGPDENTAGGPPENTSQVPPENKDAAKEPDANGAGAAPATPPAAKDKDKPKKKKGFFRRGK